MSFAFEVIFVKIYSLAVLLFEREKIGGQAGRKIFSQGQKDLIRRRITHLFSFRNKLVVSSSVLVVSQSSN